LLFQTFTVKCIKKEAKHEFELYKNTSVEGEEKRTSYKENDKKNERKEKLSHICSKNLLMIMIFNLKKNAKNNPQ